MELDRQKATYYFSPTDDGGITLKKVEKEKGEGAVWRDDFTGSTPLHDDSIIQDHTLQHDRLGKFIVVSSEKKMFTAPNGTPVTLHALILGEKKEAARFQTIEISGP
jgi:hypothetical protein